jgi:hypothetical protein
VSDDEATTQTGGTPQTDTASTHTCHISSSDDGLDGSPKKKPRHVDAENVLNDTNKVNVAHPVADHSDGRLIASTSNMLDDAENGNKTVEMEPEEQLSNAGAETQSHGQVSPDTAIRALTTPEQEAAAALVQRQQYTALFAANIAAAASNTMASPTDTASPTMN